MKYKVKTNNEEVSLGIRVVTAYPTKIFIKAYDAERPNIVLTDRYKTVKGSETFYVRMPLTGANTIVDVCDEYEKIRDFKSMLTSNAELSKRSYILPVTPVKLFIPASPLGGSGNGHKGASRFSAPNPATGAVIVYNIEKEFSTIASRRKKKETDAVKNPNALIYPAKDSIVVESMEEAAKVYMVIRSSQEVTPSNVVAKFAVNAAKGLAKTEGNLR
jgi:hypothetical protein